MSNCTILIWNRVSAARGSKCAQPEHATLTHAASLIFPAITGPGQIERSTQFQTQSYDLRFTQGNQRRDYFNFTLSGTRLDDSIKSLVVSRTAVGISGAVLFHRTNINPGCA